MSNCVVNPLLPSHIFELIYSGWNCQSEDDSAYGSAAMLEMHARFLNPDTKTDLRCESARCCTSLEIMLAENSNLSGVEESYRKNCLSKRLFAARLVESLWHLRFNNDKQARASLVKASDVYSKRKFAFDKAVVLESLGLVKALVDELEDKLARIEPCL